MYIIMNVRSTLEIRDARLSFTRKLPGFQQIAFVDTDTGELQERRLQQREEAEKFYRDLAAQGMKVRVGMEARGHGRWFERLLTELQFELWIGDAAEIST
jgi:transposase